MIRHCALVLLVGCGGSQTPSTPAPPNQPIETVSPDNELPATCDAGYWVPQAQEPPQYIACAVDADCVKMALPGCCTTTHVAIRRDRVCGGDLGSGCELECADVLPVHPEGAAAMRAACVASKCTLVR